MFGALIGGAIQAAGRDALRHHELELEYNQQMFNYLQKFSQGMMSSPDKDKQQWGLSVWQTLIEKGPKGMKDIIKGIPHLPDVDTYKQQKMDTDLQSRMEQTLPDLQAGLPSTRQPQPKGLEIGAGVGVGSPDNYVTAPPPLPQQTPLQAPDQLGGYKQWMDMAEQGAGPKPQPPDPEKYRDYFGNLTQDYDIADRRYQNELTNWTRKYDSIMERFRLQANRPTRVTVPGTDPRIQTFGADPKKSYHIWVYGDTGELASMQLLEAPQTGQSQKGQEMAIVEGAYAHEVLGDAKTPDQMTDSEKADARLWWMDLSADARNRIRSQLRVNPITGSQFEWTPKKGARPTVGGQSTPAGAAPPAGAPKKKAGVGQPGGPILVAKSVENHTAATTKYDPYTIFTEINSVPPASAEEQVIRDYAWQFATGNKPQMNSAQKAAVYKFMKDNGIIGWNSAKEFEDFVGIGKSQEALAEILDLTKKVANNPTDMTAARTLGSMVSSVSSLFSKELFREAGMLTNQDIDRAMSMLPKTDKLPVVGSVAWGAMLWREQSLVNLLALLRFVQKRKELIIRNKMGNFDQTTWPKKEEDFDALIKEAKKMMQPQQQELPSSQTLTDKQAKDELDALRKKRKTGTTK